MQTHSNVRLTTGDVVVINEEEYREHADLPWDLPGDPIEACDWYTAEEARRMIDVEIVDDWPDHLPVWVAK